MTEKRVKTGCRIPTTYFVTAGAGQSDAETGIDHYETSCYDKALLEGGIENFNIIPYTSVLPPEAEKITRTQAENRGLFHHGAVLETIKAQAEGVQGDHLCAGVATCKVYDEKRGVLIGGFAAEYEGHASESKARKILREDLIGIVKRRYGHKQIHGEYKIEPSSFEFHTKSMVVDDEYGLVLVALCFVEYEWMDLVIPSD